MANFSSTSGRIFFLRTFTVTSKETSPALSPRPWPIMDGSAAMSTVNCLLSPFFRPMISASKAAGKMPLPIS